jgi:pyridoxamine 5'-phosphate oxidase
MEFHYLAKNPFQQFHDWFKEAELKADMKNPNAMNLATVGKDGKPSSRMVLLKGVSEKGFVFFTNYNSRKGLELTQSGEAALCFYWDKLQRQVRVEGKVQRLSREESTVYFHTRPRGSQIAAWASNQSEEIPSREFLDKRVQEQEQRFHNVDPIPLPENWGGFLLIPETVEFWVGQTNRLHDRFVYERKGEEWKIKRLSP